MCVCPLCLVFSQGQYWNESSDSFGSAQPPHTQARAPGAPLQLSPGPSAMSSYIVGVLVSSPASGNGPRTHAVGSCLLDSCLWHVCHRSPALSPADPNRTLWLWFISSPHPGSQQTSTWLVLAAWPHCSPTLTSVRGAREKALDHVGGLHHRLYGYNSLKPQRSQQWQKSHTL